MKESNPEIQQNRKELIVRIVKNPYEYLENNKQKGCIEAIKFLLQVRGELQSDGSIVIAGPDPIFKMFYAANTDSIQFYEALVTMLKKTGYSKEDTELALFDWLSEEIQSSLHIKEHSVRIGQMCQSAVMAVFREDSQTYGTN